MQIATNKITSIAKEVFALEAKEIANLSQNLTKDFEQAVQKILATKGKVIISGMGKSGIIGKKISATLASTGTPSFFLHPAEAYHGDLGMIEAEDIVILISNSGESDEILKLIPFLKEQHNVIIAMSGNPSSTLAKNSHYHLNISVEKEACPLQLAPTSSTTATLVMGDALAVVLMQLRGFRDENFAKFHPGGSLGRRLLTKVGDVMQTQNLPTAKQDSLVVDIVHTISQGGLGLCVIVNNHTIEGIVTDGDIRRAMRENQKDFFKLKAKDIMSYNPKSIDANEKLTIASEMMNHFKINALLAVDSDEQLVGIIQMYDIGT